MLLSILHNPLLRLSVLYPSVVNLVSSGLRHSGLAIIFPIDFDNYLTIINIRIRTSFTSVFSIAQSA